MTHKFFSEVTELKDTMMKELLFNQSTFLFLKMQGQDMILLFLLFLVKFRSGKAPQRVPKDTVLS